MDNLYNMSSLKTLEQFTDIQPYIASYQHNFANGLLTVVIRALNEFVDTMRDLYLSQLWQTQLIIYIFLGAICALVILQIPFICSIDSVINAQARLFLKMPTSQCREQQKRADSFLEQFKVYSLIFFLIECSHNKNLAKCGF